MQISTVIILVILVLLVIGYFWLIRIGDAANIAEWGSKSANRIDGLNRLFMRSYHRVPTVSIKLPAEGPAIVVANHISGLDAFMLLASSSRPLHFLIAQEEYNRFGLQWLFDLAGCIPVERTTHPEHALRIALHALQEGKVVALFPFAHMHLDSEAPIKIKGGVAVLAEHSGATIYPARIEGAAVRKKIIQAGIKRGHPRLFPLEPIRIEENETPREMLHRLSEALSTPIEEAT
jgi:1-acyl-sn-glycerol-3-phosphate acyltransferase